MNWFRDNAFLAGWLALPIAILAVYAQNRGRRLREVDWTRQVAQICRVPHSRPSFGLEWGFLFVQPDCRCYNSKTPLKLRLNGAPANCGPRDTRRTRFRSSVCNLSAH